MKVSVASDGTVLFVTPKGRMLVDAPSRPTLGNARRQRVSREASGQRVPQDLPPVPSAHPGAPATGDGFVLSNGAALYRDADIPWAIEAAAREAFEESLE